MGDEVAGRWVRHGECNRCGDCCRGGDPYLGTRGQPRVPGACVMLAINAEGRWTCTDRTANNPVYVNGCNVWPQHPDAIASYPNCSYWFERAE